MRTVATKSVINESLKYAAGNLRRAGRCDTYQDENNWISSFVGSLEDSGTDSVCSVVQLAVLTVTSDCCASLISALPC